MNKLTQEVVTFGPVHLEVTDKNSSVEFWRDLIGLKVRHDTEQVEIGTETQTLIVLHPVAEHPFQQGYSGLYHLAIHVPSEAEFAIVLARLMRARYPISPTDHIMSKAIYLEDPDGITVEITLETPERFSHYNIEGNRFEVIDSKGRVRGGTESLDVAEVFRHLDESKIDRPMPVETKIGHVHLYVGNLAEAYKFYKSLGFSENMFGERLGFADLSAGGKFKHRLAINTWQGLNAPQSPAGTAGLHHFNLKFADGKALEQAVANVRARKLEGTANTFTAQDPSGNKIYLQYREAKRRPANIVGAGAQREVTRTPNLLPLRSR